MAALRALIVDDSEADAELIVHELRMHFAAVEFLRVDTAAGLRAALASPGWDVIICDWVMPRFSGPEALALCRALCVETPFVIVSGMVGEEPAIAAMRAGADDYVLKHKLTRLGATIEREVCAVHERSALLRRRAEDDRFFELASDMFCIVGFDGRFRRLNAAWQRTLGWSVEELMASPWFERVHSDDRDMARAAVRRLVEQRTGVADFETRMICKDGGDRSLLWSAVVAGGEPLIYAVAHDTSVHRALKRQLLQAQNLEVIGLLTAGVAHDFNNLLAVMLASTTGILHDLTPEDPLRADLDEIHGACKRAAELTRQLLAFGRRQSFAPRLLDIDAMLGRMERMLRRLLRDDVRLTMRCGVRLGQVRADPGQLEQLILNLVVNARDAMPRGGELVIETSDTEIGDEPASDGAPVHTGVAPGAYVLLSVADNGIGMDAATRARIFEPFFTTKDVERGSGLGLSTVLGIVEQSGGQIQIDSKPAHGTTFRIYLPRCETESQRNA